LGFNGQKSVGQAILIWCDAGWQRAGHFFLPRRTVFDETRLTGWEMRDVAQLEIWSYAALAGASYTTEWGPTLSLEAYVNDRGYSDKERNDYYKMIDELSAIRFDARTAQARLALARAINPGAAFIGRHYLFAQINQNDLAGMFDLNVRGIQSLDDGGHLASTVLEWNFAPMWQAYLVGLVGFGADTDEFGRFLRGQIMLGVVYRS
jgi:hypothetical protein